MTKIINLLGGPGVGKSTTASGLYYRMKRAYISCEYVAEFAKDVTWEGTQALLENQIYVFAEQFHRQWRLLGKVDYIVTDSPLILSCVYHDYAKHKLAHPEYVEATKQFFLETYRQFDNNAYLLGRERKYVANGRNQTEDEARAVDDAIRSFMHTHDLAYKEMPPADAAINQILYDIGLEELMEPDHADTIKYTQTVLADLAKANATIAELSEKAWMYDGLKD